MIASYESNEGVNFVAAIEHNEFPFFGVQFHPEKNKFDFSDYFLADHSNAAVEVSTIFQKYFVKLMEHNQNNTVFNENFFSGIQPLVLENLGYYKDLMVFNRNAESRKYLQELDKNKQIYGLN